MAKETTLPEVNEKNFMFLSPINHVVEIKGKLFYHEGSQAWNMLRFKKEVLDKFPYLKDKQGNFMYLMKIPESFKELRKEIEKMEKGSNAVPMILLLARQKNQDL